MTVVRFSSQFHPPPNFNKVIEGIKRHGTFKQRGYVKFEDLRSIALASDRMGYATKSQIAELRNFLVSSATVIEDGSQKYFFDPERAQTVLACCDAQTVLPAGINPQQRLKFLKYRQTHKKEDVSLDVSRASETTEVNVDPKTVTSETESVVMRWLIRLTAGQAKVILAVAVGEMTTRVSTLLGVFTTEPLKQIGLLVKHGDRRFSEWTCDLAIVQQCRFDISVQENHRRIPVVHEVEHGQMIVHNQWKKDLEQIKSGMTTELISVVPEQIGATVESETRTPQPKVVDTQQEIPPSVQMNLPVQYAFIDASPQTLTDDQLEEAMLAILVLIESLRNRHGQFVEVKKARIQTKIRDACAEKDRLDAELRNLRSREQELEQARALTETKLASLQQSIAA